ncbi:methyl-accepting chemotaxis protein [Azospirillaceae bacterium]
MEQVSFSGRFKVSTRIYAGFGVILCLLVLLAVLGVQGMNGAMSAFDTYAQVGHNAIRVSNIETKISQMRLSVRFYAQSGDEKELYKIKNAQKDIYSELRTAISQTINPERKRNLEKVIEFLDGYIMEFSAIPALLEKQHRLVFLGMNPIGQKAREDLASIVQSAMADNDMEAAALAGQVQEKLMRGRLEAVRFVGNPEQASLDKARSILKEYILAAEQLHDRLRHPTRKMQAEEGKAMAVKYLAALNEASETIQALDISVMKSLPSKAGEISNLINNVSQSQNKAMEDKNAEIDEDLTSSIRANLWISIGAVLIGVLFAWRVAASISGPVKAMTGAMTALAGGDLNIEIPALLNRDEIGSMAKAVHVFKENAQEKYRMDNAERKRVEEERQIAQAQSEREQKIGQEISALIQSVSQGDLSRRLDLKDKTGFYRTMSEGINRLTDTIEGVIAELGTMLSALANGDLEKRISKNYQGAFHQLKADFNATSDTLAQIVGQISAAGETIAIAAAEVSSGSSDLSERTEQQASSLEETAASMEQLGATVRSNAETAQRANKMAADTRKAAESGGGGRTLHG